MKPERGKPGQHLDVLHSGGWLSVYQYLCRTPASGPGPEEASADDHIAFPYRGVFVKETAGRRVVADGNQVLFFGKNDPYRVAHPAEAGDDCLVLSPRRADLLELMVRHDPTVRDRPEAPFRIGHAVSTPRAAVLVQALRSILSRPAVDDLEVDEVAGALIDESFLAAFGARRPPESESRPATAARRRDTVEALQKCLAMRYRERLSLHELAREVASSPFHLARLFRRETGLPIHRYRLRLRLREALLRLAETRAGITELALDLGFGDHSHLTRSFQAEYGLSPAAWRKAIRSDALRRIAQA
ncbi:MAG TPA: AraC family transcriptional regulator [Candidatus Polarisedimenticolia bacterium]|nr:AraC family transcriptional regulator [Candidatus Polarisedimenticolia bacterium]